MNVRLFIAVFARGLLMGIADLIPGVSGGTIAFISGIYQRLLNAISAFSKPLLWQLLWQFNIRRLWQFTDAAFLLALAAGILCAVLLFSSLLHHWLETSAHLLLGFFFGMVVASIITTTRRLTGATALHAACAAAAACATFYIVAAEAITVSNISRGVLFGGGMIAICAMLLPGISGSYILLILGLYPAIITAVHERDLATLFVVAAGCGCGLLMFARLLSMLLARFYNAVIAILIGVMAGALPKLWPWKETADGVKIILQPNVMPATYGANADVLLVGALTIGGMASVLLIDYWARRNQHSAG